MFGIFGYCFGIFEVYNRILGVFPGSPEFQGGWYFSVFFVEILGRAIPGLCSRRGCSWGEKKPIKKNHIKEFGGRMPRRRPRDKLGTSQGHMGHLGLIYA